MASGKQRRPRLEDAILITLWTFESRAKFDQFAKVLKNHDIPFEIQSKLKLPNPNGVAIAVEEDYYDDAKRVLIKYRKRRTSSDKSVRL
jgi:hypothetical protein